MLQHKDIKCDRTISTKALLSAQHYRIIPAGHCATRPHTGIYAGMALVLFKADDMLPGHAGLIYELDRQGRNRWKCVGMGRADLSQYKGVFE